MPNITITLNSLKEKYKAKDTEDLVQVLSSELQSANKLANIFPEIQGNIRFISLKQDTELVQAMLRLHCTTAIVENGGYRLIK